MKKRIIVKTARPSKREQLVTATAQEWAHQNTAVINSRRRVFQFEAQETEIAIVQLAAALTNQKEKLARLDATIEGLGKVIGARGGN